MLHGVIGGHQAYIIHRKIHVEIYMGHPNLHLAKTTRVRKDYKLTLRLASRGKKCPTRKKKV